MYLPLTLLALLTPSEPSSLAATPAEPLRGSAALAAAEEPPKKPQPKPKPQPQPDPCPACGMG